MKQLKAQTRVALVVGASSGIGQAIAQELGRHGIKVYAASRSLPDFFEHPENPQTAPQPWLRTVSLDVHLPASGEKAIQRILAAEGRLDYLVQSAGFGIAGAIEDTHLPEARSQFETNFFGSVCLLPAVLEQMRKQRSGLIVNIGSVAGILPVPFQAYYSASKAALAALTSALGNEIRPWHIRCMLVQPGDTRTGFTQARVMARQALQSVYAERCKRSIDRMAHDEQHGMSTSSAARSTVRAMLRRRPPQVLTLGLQYKLFAFAMRLVPNRLVQYVIYLLYAKACST